MPYEVAIPAIQAELIEMLEDDTALAALLAVRPTARGGGPAIWEDGRVPLGALFPYLVIGAWTQVPFHSLSPDGNGYGWNCTGMIKAVGQSSEAEIMAVMSAVYAVLPDGIRLDVHGYPGACCGELNLQPTLKETLANVVTYAVPAILRVYVD